MRRANGSEEVQDACHNPRVIVSGNMRALYRGCIYRRGASRDGAMLGASLDLCSIDPKVRVELGVK